MTDEGMTGAPPPGADAAEATDARAEAAESQAYVRHELRTPLAVLQPVLDMLLDGSAGELEPRQREYVVMLERNTARLAGMITSLVETGWLEIARVPPQAERVGLVPLLRELAKLVVAQLERAPRVEVHGADTRHDERGGAAALADPHRLRLALRNLLVNACSFTPPTGSVIVTVIDGGDGHVLVEIEDSGCGIPAAELPRVFEIGFQGAAAQAVPDRGLGLGLSVTRALVEEAGGAVTIRSEAGRGTTVVVQLPAAPA